MLTELENSMLTPCAHDERYDYSDEVIQRYRDSKNEVVISIDTDIFGNPRKEVKDE